LASRPARSSGAEGAVFECNQVPVDRRAGSSQIAPKWPGYSKTIHYEITGAGRIDYQFNPAASDGARGDQHGAVKIMSIDLGSH